jgi:MFS transporter, MFS domain-containing protein family, molybdate-anion transporter
VRTGFRCGFELGTLPPSSLEKLSNTIIQGPFLYALYRDEFGLSAILVSRLFTTVFVAGAISASVTGKLADRRGRRGACLVFCVSYAISCLLTTIPNVPLLYLSRILGGISTSLLFSVFESWMVTDFHNRFLEKKGLNLSRTFGTMSTINSVTAIASGLVSEWLVKSSGTKKAPFYASMGLLALAFLFIYGQWVRSEFPLFRSLGDRPLTCDCRRTRTTAPRRQRTSLRRRAPASSAHVLSLALAATMLEGSMYLYVFFWAPALKATVPPPLKGQPERELPYGIIFASFMASMMAASLIFNILMSTKVLTYTQLLLALLGVSDICFFYLIKPKSEQLTFWLFCAFEACVGMYWPCVGYLKGRLVDDSVRAEVYGILRVPLNIFVVLALMAAGNPNAYGAVFSVCSMLLLGALGALFITSRGETMP